MIEIRNLTRSQGGARILDNIDLDIAEGSFVGLLGPSGSGKTTLLRLIAGLDYADSGTITIDGKPANQLSPAERKVGFVFQSYALFGHMSVFENIAFGLRVKPRKDHPTEQKLKAEVERWLTMMHLEGLGPRLPAQLSGGQRQRVALARALAVAPRILLLDEPFGALDHEVRQSLRDGLKQVHTDLGLTTIFVSHDTEEAKSLANRILTLHRGRIAEAVGG